MCRIGYRFSMGSGAERQYGASTFLKHRLDLAWEGSGRVEHSRVLGMAYHRWSCVRRAKYLASSTALPAPARGPRRFHYQHPGPGIKS